MTRLLSALLILLLLTACSSNDSENTAAEKSAPQSQGNVQPDDRPDSSTILTVGDEAAPPAAPGESAPAAERMVIKTGDLSLIVDDPLTALDQVSVIAAEYGGYVISSQITSSDPVPTATITLAVNAEQFETAMSALRQIGTKILSDSSSGQDVTAEYVDLESRLRSLEATRDRIMTFLEQAANVTEALQVNNELANIEQQIEEVKGRMNYLSTRTDFSTITVRLRAPNPPSDEKSDEGWSAKRTLENAWDAQKDLAQFLADALIWLLIYAGPYLLVVVLGAFGYRRWYRAHRPKA
ncbi:MAG TPA: DUF4349 domain-containing protein [Aggregatilineaceae bacterium]|nr:DUF4349 domain-containing protein [Aggregatilineaceae bacterium]